MAYARELLKGKFDFTADETLQIDREKAPWAKNEDEARDLWRKRVKNDWLRLKLAGKDDKGIRETLDKRYEGYQSRLKKLNNEDVFQMFMNAYATAIEPHTNYLGPRSAENFDIMMRLSLDGIGAVLQSRDDYTVIREVVPGGPADKSGKLKVGDRIVGVAQGNGAFTDVMGWRIDDVVQLVRGERNSTVRLDVLPADAGQDGKHVTIPLVRQKISMEEQSAKKQIIEVKDGGVKRRIGVISLPTFYQDFEARRKGDKDFKSATRDVQRILGELKKEKVDNVLIDLRNNGGGSLIEAVELTGLFIDKGPVVQQRTAEGRVDVESDTQAGLAWDGPMGVLINRGSASASEIFAAAIQDYGRGIVIGEPSFGKGTVQTLINLDRFSQNDKVKYGELKMTIAQFFRINGGTTQLRGVTPDIKLPVTSDAENFGESSYDNALPWVQIKPATYLPSGDLKELVNPLQKRHEVRVAKDKEFRDIEQDIAEALKLRKDNVDLAERSGAPQGTREPGSQGPPARIPPRRRVRQSNADEPVAGPGSKEQRAKAPNPTAPKKSNVALKGAPRRTTACRATSAAWRRKSPPRRRPRTPRTSICRKPPTSWPTNRHAEGRYPHGIAPAWAAAWPMLVKKPAARTEDIGDVARPSAAQGTQTHWSARVSTIAGDGLPGSSNGSGQTHALCRPVRRGARPSTATSTSPMAATTTASARSTWTASAPPGRRPVEGYAEGSRQGGRVHTRRPAWRSTPPATCTWPTPATTPSAR
jgi:carboxyl-terminal processing protease